MKYRRAFRLVLLLAPALAYCGGDRSTPGDAGPGDAGAHADTGGDASAAPDATTGPMCDEATNTACGLVEVMAGANVVSSGDHVCGGGLTCHVRCPEGGCTQRCEEGASCDLTCGDGSCVLDCATTGTCCLRCPDGGCVTCETGDCMLRCP